MWSSASIFARSLGMEAVAGGAVEFHYKSPKLAYMHFLEIKCRFACRLLPEYIGVSGRVSGCPWPLSGMVLTRSLRSRWDLSLLSSLCEVSYAGVLDLAVGWKNAWADFPMFNRIPGIWCTVACAWDVLSSVWGISRTEMLKYRPRQHSTGPDNETDLDGTKL